MKRLFLLMSLLLAFATPNFAQTACDTVRMEWVTEERFKHFFFTGTENGIFVVDWGDGKTENVTATEINKIVSHSYDQRDSSYQVMFYATKSDTRILALHYHKTYITSLDLSGCSALTSLICNGDSYKYQPGLLSNIDLSGCSSLYRLDCSYNQLKNIELSDCSTLQYLYCDYNQLISLDLSSCSDLIELCCSNNHLMNLDLKDCPALSNLRCDYNSLSIINLNKNAPLNDFICNNNQLTNIDLERNTNLHRCRLICNNNQLTTLDISGCYGLTTLDCSYNYLTSLDLSGCYNLTGLDCSYNHLTKLDLNDCRSLTGLNCSYNHIQLPILYQIHLIISQKSHYQISANQFDSIILCIDQPWDLSLEKILGEPSTFEITDTNGVSLPYNSWTEINSRFQFHKIGNYTLALQNPNLINIEYNNKYLTYDTTPLIFTWHISVVEKLPDEHYMINVSSNNFEWGSAIGNSTYTKNSEATITATPNEGYRFINWKKKDGTVFSTDLVHTFKVTENLELTANFERIPDAPIVEENFTVSVASNNEAWGTATLTGNGTYKKDTLATITATPAEGYHFVCWTKDNEVFSAEAIHTFAVTENLELIAIFSPGNIANESQKADNLRIYAQGRTIYLSENRGLVQVFNTLGQCVYSGTATAIPVRTGGLYIVRIGLHSYKVLVR